MNAGPMATGSLVGSALTLGIAGPAAAAAGAAAAWGEEIGSMAVGGGTIKIDIEQAPSVIAEIDKAILAVKKITRSMGNTNWLEPPGLDDYSGYAVSGISGADQRHNDASSKYLQILTETREKLQQSYDAYKRGDSVASDGITKSGTLL